MALMLDASLWLLDFLRRVAMRNQRMIAGYLIYSRSQNPHGSLRNKPGSNQQQFIDIGKVRSRSSPSSTSSSFQPNPQLCVRQLWDYNDLGSNQLVPSRRRSSRSLLSKRSFPEDIDRVIASSYNVVRPSARQSWHGMLEPRHPWGRRSTGL